MTKLGVLVVFIIGLLLGVGCGVIAHATFAPIQTSADVESLKALDGNPFGQQIAALKPGESLVIDDSKGGWSFKYEGADLVVKDNTGAVRVLSPFGMSPAELIAANKGISIGGAEVAGNDWTWYDSVKSWLHNALWFVGLGILALVVIPIILPAAAPVVGGILSFIGQAVAAVIPIFGYVVAWMKANVFHTAATQIVDGDEAFKTALAADTTISQDIRDKVLAMFRDAHLKAHDDKTNQVVAAIKG